MKIRGKFLGFILALISITSLVSAATITFDSSNSIAAWIDGFAFSNSCGAFSYNGNHGGDTYPNPESSFATNILVSDGSCNVYRIPHWTLMKVTSSLTTASKAELYVSTTKQADNLKVCGAAASWVNPVSWNTRPGKVSTQSTNLKKCFSFTSLGNNRYKADITELYNQWADNPSENYGFFIFISSLVPLDGSDYTYITASADAAHDGTGVGWITHQNYEDHLDSYTKVYTGYAADSGKRPVIETTPSSCTPSCSGKECGDDGCGGSCGTCNIGYTCQSNQCVDESIPPAPSLCAGGDSQLIMKLSSTTNAHGEIYSSTNYNIGICYDAIFGSVYTGANPHTCSGTNLVLKLSSTTNAHAEIPSLTNYNTNVCYGNLVCTLRDSCQSGETLVASLSSNTNAHLSSTSSYPAKICCSTSGTTPPSGRFWANMAGTSITSADLGDTVKMIWLNTGLSQGTSVSFEIYEDDILIDDAIRTGASAITSAVNSNGDAIAYWTITQADLAKTSSDYSSFYFKVGNQNSNNLEVQETTRNSPPQVQITSPSPNQLFKKNSPVQFNYSVYDEDDSVTINIAFGDGQTQALTNLNGTVQHSYPTSGIKTASITATDSRGLSATKYIDVFIIKQYLNIFPVISDPDENEQLASKTVSFDASDSFAVYCSLEEVNTCTLINPSSLTFSWIFSDSTTATGNQPTKTFSSSGKKTANLTVKFTNSSVSGQISKVRTFLIGGCNGLSPGECSINGKSYCNDAEELLDTSNSGEACAGYDGEIGTDDDCCPAGSSCTEDGCTGGDDEECFYLSNCGSYLNEDDCEADICNLGEFGIGTDVCNSLLTGYYVSGCACSWNDNEESCALSYSAQHQTTHTTFSCDKTFEETPCVNAQKTVTWTAISSDPLISEDDLKILGCVNEEEIYPCGEYSLTLDFTSSLSILAFISLIIIFYIFKHKQQKITTRKVIK
ncbi:hypothetical protein COV15_01875 [Candidatus Woesearchaeota archaeon CG10_big_fil_rev_8_21_14_0_10_34_12]|nr:MAG: hypothetical protein COV15_01875 [Candidatus Woesearchaeota archaeon CG10_big_fil_rev_8_21_14_0_10_34_12]